MNKFYLWASHSTELKGDKQVQSQLVGSCVATGEDAATGFAFRQCKGDEPGSGVTSIAVGALNMNRVSEYINPIIISLAKEFSHELQGELGADIFKVICRNLRAPFSTTCASHDFCDANEVMAKAFKTVMGREINLQSDYDKWIWGMAWTLAKNSAFYIEPQELARTAPRSEPSVELQAELTKRGWKRSESWFGEGNWFAAYHYKAKSYTEGQKKPCKFYLITVAACTGAWTVEILESTKTFKVEGENVEYEIYEDPNEDAE